MIDSLESDLDISTQKIKNLEKEVADIQNVIYQLSESLKETQRYLVKLAHNQSELTKRVSMWPYIVVEKNEGE